MNIKKILASLLAVVVVGANMPAVSMNFPKISITANAEETISPLTYEILEDGTIEISRCDPFVTEIEIPAEIDGKKVTSIGERAFAYCKNLTSITIPNSVTSIGYGAFEYCENLSSITIPDSVTSIGGGAFALCSKLTSITIPDSVTSIGDNAVWYCSSLTEITIPNSVTNIGDYAFAYCSSLTSITILNPNCEIADKSATISNDYDNGDFYFNGTIYGYENSTAQAYAEKYNRKFESLGDAPVPELATGDINGDKSVDSSDAAVVLVDYASTSTGGKSTLTDAQKAAADIDNDGKIDASDASYILQFYSYISTGGTETDIAKWFENIK